MSVRSYNEGLRLRLYCDWPGCANHYDLDNTQAAMKESDDWLTRHGWRTVGGRLHYCKFCAAKHPAFQSEVTDAEQERRLRAGRSGRYSAI